MTEQNKIDQKTIETLADAVTKAINSNEGNKRFIDLERIPLICLSISNISKSLDTHVTTMGKAMEEIKHMIIANKEDSDKQHDKFVTKDGQYFIVRAIVFTGTGLVLTGVITGFIKLILDSL